MKVDGNVIYCSLIFLEYDDGSPLVEVSAPSIINPSDYYYTGTFNFILMPFIPTPSCYPIEYSCAVQVASTSYDFCDDSLPTITFDTSTGAYSFVAATADMYTFGT